MSASAMVDAAVTMLSAASVFGSGMVGKENYSVLNIASGSCAVVNAIAMESRPSTFGNPRGRDHTYRLQIEGFCKDGGDEDAALARVLTMFDTVTNCLESDDTLLGSADTTGGLTIRFNPNRAVIIGGQTLLYVVFTLDADDI